MIGPLSLSIALLLHPMEPHARAQIRVEPDFGLQAEWAACHYFSLLIYTRSFEAAKDCPFIRSQPKPEAWLRENLRMVYVAPGLLEISLPTRGNPEGATVAVNAIVEKAVPGALAYWEDGLKKTVSNLKVEIKNRRRLAEEFRQRAAEATLEKRDQYLEAASEHLNRIPEYETQIDRMERSLAQGLPRAKVIQRAKP